MFIDPLFLKGTVKASAEAFSLLANAEKRRVEEQAKINDKINNLKEKIQEKFGKK